MGTGPTLKLTVGNTEVWKIQINLQTGDYPYDTGCGAPSDKADKYSPWQEATFGVPADVGGSMVLTMIGTDRNIHVIGDGLQCTSKTDISFQGFFSVSNISTVFHTNQHFHSDTLDVKWTTTTTSTTTTTTTTTVLTPTTKLAGMF